MKGIVYVCANGSGQFKIGYSCQPDVRERKWAIQTMIATKTVRITCIIETEYPDVLERQLHAEFWHRKSRGGQTGEWFNLSEEDLDNLKGRDGYH
jgi:hypothetical protein